MLDDFLKYQAKTTPHPLGLEIREVSIPEDFLQKIDE